MPDGGKWAEKKEISSESCCDPLALACSVMLKF